MGDVDLKIRFKMEDPANVTQMLMQNIKALAVLQQAGVGTVMTTANVLDALTFGALLILVSMFPDTGFASTPNLILLLK